MKVLNETLTYFRTSLGYLHFLVIEQHAVHLDDGHICGLLCLKVDKPVSLGLSLVVQHHLTGEDVTKGTEYVIEGFVVNRLVQVLDKDVSDTGSPQGGVTLRPHDTHRAVLDGVKVHGVQSPLSCGEKTKV